ncbi:MAG: glycosyltransferase family 2 protein [Gemmataceae bacterium]
MFRRDRGPSWEEVQAHVPEVPHVPDGESRPFWSVMVPTYNCAHYLRKTLESILCQDPGADQMQIEVVDDCSTRDDPAAVVAELGKGRVQFHRKPKNEGVTAVFNTCLQRSRGRWVHILHGDDMVLPGMYQAYRKVIEATDPVMVLGRVIFIDEADSWLGMFGPEPIDGIIKDFVLRQAFGQLGLFAGVVIRRSIYEKVGGYCPIFGHVADWDMWLRVGQEGRVATLRQPYGLYRIHTASDSSRLMVTGKNVQESYSILRLNRERLGMRPEHVVAYRQALADLAKSAEKSAWILDSKGSTEGRLNQACWAWKLAPNRQRFLLLIKSWLKHRLANTGKREQSHKVAAPTSQPCEVTNATLSHDMSAAGTSDRLNNPNSAEIPLVSRSIS